MSGRFADKVVIVSGAASGIGLAAARAFAREGGRVVVADIDLGGAERAAAAIAASGGTASAVRVDVADAAYCAAMVEHAVAAFGGLDVAFNNAGVPAQPYAAFEEIDAADWARVLAINVTGILHAMKAEAAAMRARGRGAIVNTASAASFQAVPGLAPYIASKHAVAGLTKAAAIDLAASGIRVNAICPGIVETPMMAPFLAEEAGRAAMTALAPIGRLARPEEMADAVLHLASDQASYMVGTLMIVDGGLLLP